MAFKWEEILGITCCGDGDEPTCSWKKKNSQKKKVQLLIHSCLKKKNKIASYNGVEEMGFSRARGSNKLDQDNWDTIDVFWNNRWHYNFHMGFKTWQPIHKLWQKVQQSKWSAH